MHFKLYVWSQRISYIHRLPPPLSNAPYAGGAVYQSDLSHSFAAIIGYDACFVESSGTECWIGQFNILLEDASPRLCIDLAKALDLGPLSSPRSFKMKV